LKGFLDQLTAEYPNGADLVIAGDLLELWQHPEFPCDQVSRGCGCPLAQVRKIAEKVIDSHAGEFAALGGWVNRHPNNRLTIIPGNHDAALMEQDIKELVERKIGGLKGRVHTAAINGLWVSEDGTTVVEHGHQISKDVNSFPKWPLVRGNCPGEPRLFRPWGEHFVESLYSSREKDLQIIDNLTSEWRGAWVYAKRQGFWKSVSDAAEFVLFNIFETSLRQKAQLGKPQGSGAWDVERARKRGYDLIVNSMEADDPIRNALIKGQSDRYPSLDIAELRRHIDKSVQSMDAASIGALCDKIEVRKRTFDPKLIGCGAEQGQFIADQLSSLPKLLGSRLNELKSRYKMMSLYIYGHTHQSDYDITIPVQNASVQVVNTGAFQRLIDYPTFKKEAQKRNISEEEALGVLTLEKDLAACYPVVKVRFTKGTAPSAILQHWYMPEDAERGEFIRACDNRCTALPTRCGRE
jgi:hypothetical protein